jgi:hypothetical protein
MCLVLQRAKKKNAVVTSKVAKGGRERDLTIRKTEPHCYEVSAVFCLEEVVRTLLNIRFTTFTAQWFWQPDVIVY